MIYRSSGAHPFLPCTSSGPPFCPILPLRHSPGRSFICLGCLPPTFIRLLRLCPRARGTPSSSLSFRRSFSSCLPTCVFPWGLLFSLHIGLFYILFSHPLHCLCRSLFHPSFLSSFALPAFESFFPLTVFLLASLFISTLWFTFHSSRSFLSCDIYPCPSSILASIYALPRVHFCPSPGCIVSFAFRSFADTCFSFCPSMPSSSFSLLVLLSWACSLPLCMYLALRLPGLLCPLTLEPGTLVWLHGLLFTRTTLSRIQSFSLLPHVARDANLCSVYLHEFQEYLSFTLSS